MVLTFLEKVCIQLINTYKVWSKNIETEALNFKILNEDVHS